ncbi:succinate-semialdehyde dehydrogenase [Candidatus Woesearchaeota archaeon]|jgi:acyl-CoA reductase-like NAD-dependent aldehyde dehydrogenase|nr:succinate-semialdehyde dehydrogenase [Candidatus Woesearchaeota archaeon]|tara:strand:+ start:18035 stop:19411 length:1377 start_codon:yes stop_codon:yes gene_type:complete
MKFKTINPTTEEIISEYETISKEGALSIAKSCHDSYKKWKNVDISERSKLFRKLAEVLRKNKDEYAKLMTTEMGKPISQSLAEIEKCAWTAEVYADNAAKWLEEETAQADGKKHLVTFEPLGTILSIMPWNFPFNQAFRFAIPTIISGNTSILKHSNVVPQCAMAIEESFKEAGFPENVFRTAITDHQTIEELVKSDYIRGVSLTGSTAAGAKIAELAGRNLKKVVLELGGSDPFIVLDDADIEFAAKNAVKGRTINSGQSCIAAKRFIVTKNIADAFSKKFAELTDALVVDDPMNEKTEIGPLVNSGGLKQIESQVNDAVGKGAMILAGGKRLDRKGYFYSPTVLGNVKNDMKAVTEEVFGPVAPIIVVNDEQEALKVANNTEFGLGASVWTKDENKGIQLAKNLEAGCLFINSIVKSDPRMPFGGVKKSGIGRELSKYGLKEFVNVKAINVYETRS